MAVVGCDNSIAEYQAKTHYSGLLKDKMVEDAMGVFRRISKRFEPEHIKAVPQLIVNESS